MLNDATIGKTQLSTLTFLAFAGKCIVSAMHETLTTPNDPARGAFHTYWSKGTKPIARVLMRKQVKPSKQ